MQLRIFGAGLAGLLCGHMLKRFDPIICEKQTSLPNNHAALLRFRTEAVSDATGIPFKQVKVSKAIACYDGLNNRVLTKTPMIKHSNQYSFKVTGKYISRSINNLEDSIRYIAPSDFINRASKSLSIQYETDIHNFLKNDKPKVSTIPLPILLLLLGYQNLDGKQIDEIFRYSEAWVLNADITTKTESLDICDVYQTIYYPDPKDEFYRISITGNKLIVEYKQSPKTGKILYINKNDPDSDEPWKDIICSDVFKALEQDFGLDVNNIALNRVKIKCQDYGKILPVEDSFRKRILLMLTEEHKIYSVGRFATWRQILLDDVVHDIQVVGNMLDNKDRYNFKLYLNGDKND